MEFPGETPVTEKALARLAGKADLHKDPAIENVRKIQAAYWLVRNP